METNLKTEHIDKLLLEVQKELQGVTKDANNPHFKSNYATFNAVIDTVKEPLNSKGILIEQIPDADEFGKYVRTSLLHIESGERKSCKVYLELPKPDMQKMGSAITYAKRYGLQTLMVLPSEDDDGNVASGVINTVDSSSNSNGGFSSKINNNTSTKSFGATKNITKKAVTKKEEISKKEEPAIVAPKVPSKKVTPPPAKTSNTSNKAFSSKPSFSSRANKQEPEF